MNHEYMKDHIIEELQGAVEYMEKAVEHKGTECGEMFRCFSHDELRHANGILKIFHNTVKPDEITEAAYLKMHKDIMDHYVDGMNKIETLKHMYYAV